MISGIPYDDLSCQHLQLTGIFICATREFRGNIIDPCSSLLFTAVKSRLLCRGLLRRKQWKRVYESKEERWEEKKEEDRSGERGEEREEKRGVGRKGERSEEWEEREAKRGEESRREEKRGAERRERKSQDWAIIRSDSVVCGFRETLFSEHHHFPYSPVLTSLPHPLPI